MNQNSYNEMKSRLSALGDEDKLAGRDIYLFGHCNATETLADLILENGFPVKAILDNNRTKHGSTYRGIPIISPDSLMGAGKTSTIVCIAVRYYAAMVRQLRRLGYDGLVEKLVEYDSFAEYSLSEETIDRKIERLERGRRIVGDQRDKYPGDFRVFCPYTSFGDVFYAMSYLPLFLQERGYKSHTVYVLNQGCSQVAKLFTDGAVEILGQAVMDESITASVYDRMDDFIIAHNDKPYLVQVSKALHVKKIPFEKLYCCGVYCLPYDTEPARPKYMKGYTGTEEIDEGRTAILSPYANSVVSVGDEVWEDIIDKYKKQGFLIYTNVAPGQKPLSGTMPITPALNEIQALVERAGHFVGLRSGLCDVLKYAGCKKMALYPDYLFGRTKWKSIDIFALDGWENVEITGENKWNIS